MTTDPRKRFEHDGTMAALHAEVLADDADDMVEAADDETEAEGAALAQMLSPDMFAADVRAYVDEILRPGEPPAPAVQNRMSESARRVLRKRRSPLPVLLADARVTQHLRPADVSAAIGIDEADLHGLEFGDTGVRTLTPAQIAAWSRAVNLDPVETVAGLRNALNLRAATPSQVAAGADSEAQASRADEEYVAEVARLLGLQ